MRAGAAPHSQLADAVLGELGQELVAAQGPPRVLLLDLADEVLHVVVALGVLEVLAVGVARLEGVVLDADEVVDDVVGRGVVATHAASSCGRCRSRRSLPPHGPGQPRAAASQGRSPGADGRTVGSPSLLPLWPSGAKS